MGRKQHQSDRMYVTNKEWQEANQATNQANNQANNRTPFDHCALSLVPWKTPVCDPQGNMFDLDAIIQYIAQYKRHPLTGDALSITQLIRLNVTPVEQSSQSSNQFNNQQYMDPISKKVFTPISHVVANKLTGNVYEYATVDRLNIQANQWEDLIDGSKFTRNDLITLQNPKQPFRQSAKPVVKPLVQHTSQPSLPDPIMARSLNQTNISSSSSICSSVTPVLITQPRNQSNPESNKQSLSQLFELARSKGNLKGYVRLHLSIQPKTQLNNQSTTQTSNQPTNHTINLEIDCSATPKLAYYFLSMCENGSINQSVCRKIVPGFFVQFNDQPISIPSNQNDDDDDDDIDDSINHAARGIISCPNTIYQSINQFLVQSNNQSVAPPMFILTLGPSPDIDDTFTSFGKLVGGKQTLDVIEQSINQTTNQSTSHIVVQSVTVYTNPFKQALPDLLDQAIKQSTKEKQQKDALNNERRAWFSNPAPIARSNGPPDNQSNNQSNSQSNDQANQQSIKGPVNIDMSKLLPALKKRPSSQSNKQTANQSANQPTDESADQAGDEHVKRQRLDES